MTTKKSKKKRTKWGEPLISPEWHKGHTAGYQLGLKNGRKQLQMQIQELLDVPSWGTLDD